MIRDCSGTAAPPLHSTRKKRADGGGPASGGAIARGSTISPALAGSGLRPGRAPTSPIPNSNAAAITPRVDVTVFLLWPLGPGIDCRAVPALHQPSSA